VLKEVESFLVFFLSHLIHFTLTQALYSSNLFFFIDQSIVGIRERETRESKPLFNLTIKNTIIIDMDGIGRCLT
jgi:hypothetical protein